MLNVDSNTFLRIDLKAIYNNYKIAKKKVNKKCLVASTVKANAYGLGIKKVAPKLIKAGCNFFFVATTTEAIELRKLNSKISIFVLNGLVAKDSKLIKKYNLIPVINNLIQLKRIEKFQKEISKSVDIALHFDTGMSRLGLDKSETNSLLDNKAKYIKNSNIVLVMSHLACADDSKSKKNIKQLNYFNKIREHFPKSLHSISNSAGILLGKQFHLDMVRPGISLYGGHCQIGEKNIYKNVITLTAKLIQIREIYKNDTIGYGATFKAKSKMRIGTLPIGYADGFNRKFSNNFQLRLNKKKLEIVGRVSMDLVTVDLSNIKTKNLKDQEIEIIGDKQSINIISKLINTIPYEILTNLGKRYQRIYIS